MSGRWKDVERKMAARFFGGTRIPVLGKQDRDIDDAFGLWCDVKSRQVISERYWGAVNDAIRLGYQGVIDGDLLYLPVTGFVRCTRFFHQVKPLPRLAAGWLDHIAESAPSDRLPCIALHIPGTRLDTGVFVCSKDRYVRHIWPQGV